MDESSFTWSGGGGGSVAIGGIVGRLWIFASGGAGCEAICASGFGMLAVSGVGVGG